MSKFVSANRFAALDSDTEEPARPAAARATPQSATATSQRPRQQLQQQGPAGGAASDSRTANRRRDDLPRTRGDLDSAVTADALSAQRRDVRRGAPRGGNGERRAGGGGGGGGGAGSSRGREFERHSGTGRGREIKKHGGGAHNWGNESAALAEAEEDPDNNVLAAADADANGPPGPDQAAGVEGSAAQADAAAQQQRDERVDFAEYQKQLKKKRAALAEDAARPQNNRTVDTNELEKEGYQLLHRETNEHLVGVGAARNAADYTSSDEAAAQPRAKPANVIDLGSLQRRGNRPGGGGGDRGRGGNSSGANNGGRRSAGGPGGGPEDHHSNERNRRRPEPQQKPNVSDNAAFPAL